jgi:hypothetical protein
MGRGLTSLILPRQIFGGHSTWQALDLASPDHTPARGQPSTEPPHVPGSSAPGWRVVALEGGRGDATPPAVIVVDWA